VPWSFPYMDLLVRKIVDTTDYDYRQVPTIIRILILLLSTTTTTELWIIL